MNTVQLDQPVSEQQEDTFQRYGFAKRIAGIINAGDYSKALVIGIYAKWGEGKSSLLNFIEKEISEDSIHIKFNPWYFQEDKLLIKSFFESIASALGKKLSNKKDKIVKAFQDYGDSIGSLTNLMLPGLGLVFSAGKKVSETFKNDSLEHYRKIVTDFIQEANINITVLIDDIDRLNIDEIQSVFKLVKLVGDFPRFSYVLAFDDELIAASLGHKFGEQKMKDGYDFLEKIVQLPLTLPKASQFALRAYCLDQVWKSLEKLNIKLTDTEIQDFLGKFDTAFVPGLRNPRLAVRFANAISFAIPLLHGEVNLGDLMIIEGIKVFYPKLYYLIRSRSDVFLNSYEHATTAAKFREKAKDLLDSQLGNYGDELGLKIREMLWVLFPQIYSLDNNFVSGRPIIENWYRNKRICSVYYFHRYFSYAVSEGEISDVFFKQLFIDVDKKKPLDFANGLLDDLRKLDLQMFIYKLSHLVPSFTIPEVNNLYVVLSMLGPQIPIQQVFEVLPAKWEMAKLITALIMRLDRETRINYCMQSIDVANPFGFALALHRIFSNKQIVLTESTFLNPEEQKHLNIHLIDRFISENKSKDVFMKFAEEDLEATFEIFNQEGRTGEITTELIKRLNNKREFPGFSVKIIRLFSPTHYSSIINHPYKTIFTRENYYQMKVFIDPVIVYNDLVSTQGQFSYVPERIFTPGEECSDQDLMILFQKIHNEIYSPD